MKNAANIINYTKRNYEYPFTHKLVFAIVMKDERFCKDILERIFPDRHVRNIRLHGTEVSLIPAVDAKSVRLDVQFDDGDNWYDIEMQNADEGNLPRRTRYIHSAMDIEALDRGERFDKLPESFVIFLCRFDYLGANKAVYSFKTFDEKNGLKLDDGVHTIIVNSRSTEPNLPSGLKNLFSYMNDMIIPEGDDGLTALDEAVMRCNSEERRREMWTLEQEFKMLEARARSEAEFEGRNKGMREGLAKGMEEGLAKGMEEGRVKGMEEGRVKGMEEGRVKGMEEGRVKGMEEGRLQMLHQLVEEGKLDQKVAAEYANMSEVQFLSSNE